MTAKEQRIFTEVVAKAVEVGVTKALTGLKLQGLKPHPTQSPEFDMKSDYGIFEKHVEQK